MHCPLPSTLQQTFTPRQAQLREPAELADPQQLHHCPTVIFDASALQVDARVYHVRRVKLTGVPKEEGWPTADQLLARCRTRPGQPVTFQVDYPASLPPVNPTKQTPAQQWLPVTNYVRHASSMFPVDCTRESDHNEHPLTHDRGPADGMSLNWRELSAASIFNACFLSHIAQDIEQDSVRLLSSGVFRAARPLVFPPRGAAETYPQVWNAPRKDPSSRTRNCSSQMGPARPSTCQPLIKITTLS